MKCPCCNSEMSAGVVQSAREIFFTTEANQNWLNPFLANKNKIMLSTNNFSRPTCTAYLCQNCKQVIIHYSADAQ